MKTGSDNERMAEAYVYAEAWKQGWDRIWEAPTSSSEEYDRHVAKLGKHCETAVEGFRRTITRKP